MSSISIVCIKYAEEKEKTGKNIEDYHGDVKSKTEIDNSIKLEINSQQLFMDTEKFFNTVKTTLEKYFDEIAKK
jgi:hypothetical protein